MVEEILKSLSDNPELISLGAGAVYSALTYAAGRLHTYETTREADQALDQGYSSPADILKGLYDKGMMDAAEAHKESKRGDPYAEVLDDPVALGFEPDEDIEEQWEEIRSERQPVRGD